jgi:hypothetical protein
VCEKEELNFKCGSLQAHHFITRSNKRLRWDLQNRVFLCPSHHTLGLRSAHKSPEWFRNWFMTNRPNDFLHCEKMKNELNYSIDYAEIYSKLNEYKRPDKN